VIVRLAAILSAAPDLGLGAAGVLAVLGAATAVIGSVQAVGARDLRRLAAYAAASQGGCILLGLAIGSPAELAASLVQLLALAVAMVALLGGAAAVTDGSLVVVDGLARRAPLASAAIAAGSLSLIGAPLTIGFLGRWRMIEAGVAADWWWATGAVLAASLAAVIYGGRLIERIYFRHATVQTMDAERSWRRVLIAPALIFAIAVIVVGVNPDFVLRAAAAASTLQLGRP
jgi:formate hydrogenlyase subunit 3/multisubunit Na+/H+ antiporter MnhD subunit